MPSKTKLEQIERRVDAFYALCEKITLRTLLFGCFRRRLEGLLFGSFGDRF